MAGHAAAGSHEEGERIGNKVLEAIEEHVAEAAADDGSDDDGGDECGLLIGVVRGAFFNVVEMEEGEGDEEAEDVGEAVPANAVEGPGVWELDHKGVDVVDPEGENWLREIH